MHRVMFERQCSNAQLNFAKCTSQANDIPKGLVSDLQAFRELFLPG